MRACRTSHAEILEVVASSYHDTVARGSNRLLPSLPAAFELFFVELLTYRGNA
jgi:hypothetical protein